MNEIICPRFWYVQRETEVKGPFPAGQLRREYVLGRLRGNVRLSFDRLDWLSVESAMRLIPERVLSPLAARQKDPGLVQRVAADERCGTDRRDQRPASPDQIERRSGCERRRGETDAELQYRREKSALLAVLGVARERYQGRLALFAVGLLALLVYGASNPLRFDFSRADCTRGPAVGVNWEACSLSFAQLEGQDISGANLRSALLDRANMTGVSIAGATADYASLVNADLSYSEATSASLVGAELRGADLAYTNLADADLSYANLLGANIGGANLEGVKLDDTIWVDGRICARGSVGRCLSVSR